MPRCEVCFVETSQLKNCSGCKAIQYCSIVCQKIDWKRAHKTDCKRLREISVAVVERDSDEKRAAASSGARPKCSLQSSKTCLSKKKPTGSSTGARPNWRVSKSGETEDGSEEILVTAYGRCRAAEVADRYLGSDDLISKVVLPCEKVAKKVLRQLEIGVRSLDVDRSTPIILEEKGDRCFIDVLDYYHRQFGFPASRPKLDPEEEWENSAIEFYIEVLSECAQEGMDYAVLKSLEDYLAVVEANKRAVSAILTEFEDDETVVGKDMTLFWSFLYRGLAAMGVHATYWAGKILMELDSFESGDRYLSEALSALNHILREPLYMDRQDNKFRRRFEPFKKEILALKQSRPEQVVNRLNGEWDRLKERLRRGNFNAVDVLAPSRILQKKAEMLMKMGRFEEARENFSRSLEQLVKYQLALRKEPSGMDMEEWFAVMGSAFDKFSLYAVPGEADRSGRDVIRLQTNALLLYKAAGMVAAGPAAKVAVRLWNWRRNGRVYTRATDWMQKNKHDRFETRLFDEDVSLDALDKTMEDVELMTSVIGAGGILRDRCPLCNDDLSWHSVEAEPVEILLHCACAFHTACLDNAIAKRSEERSCPGCQAAFID